MFWSFISGIDDSSLDFSLVCVGVSRVLFSDPSSHSRVPGDPSSSPNPCAVYDLDERQFWVPSLPSLVAPFLNSFVFCVW